MLHVTIDCIDYGHVVYTIYDVTMLACRCWYKVSIYALVLVHGLYLERLHHGEFIGGRYSGSSSARIENRGLL